jgi:hypothetical protein
MLLAHGAIPDLEDKASADLCRCQHRNIIIDWRIGLKRKFFARINYRYTKTHGIIYKKITEICSKMRKFCESEKF